MRLFWHKLVHCVGNNYDLRQQIYKQISQEIRDFYFPNGARVNIDTLPQLNNLLSDLWFVNGVDRSAKFELNRSKGKTFSYRSVVKRERERNNINKNMLVLVGLKYYKFHRFSPETYIGPVKKLSGAKDLNMPGTAHIDDLFYLFR